MPRRPLTLAALAAPFAVVAGALTLAVVPPWGAALVFVISLWYLAGAR